MRDRDPTCATESANVVPDLALAETSDDGGIL